MDAVVNPGTYYMNRGALVYPVNVTASLNIYMERAVQVKRGQIVFVFSREAFNWIDGTGFVEVRVSPLEAVYVKALYDGSVFYCRRIFLDRIEGST